MRYEIILHGENKVRTESGKCESVLDFINKLKEVEFTGENYKKINFILTR